MRGKILLADGDESVRRMIGRVLESVGYEVLTAINGGEAIALFRQNSPDLLVLDVELLDPTPWQVAEAARGQSPGVPVVMLSSWPNQQRRVKDRGVDALLDKPLDLPQLISTVRLLLDKANERNGKSLPGPTSAAPGELKIA